MTSGNPQDQGEAQARRLENVSQELTRILRQPQVSQRLRITPGEAEWSAMHVMGHLNEMVPYWLAQCRVLIAADEPPAFGRALDQPERLAGPQRGASGDPDELLRQWQETVKAAAAAIRQMSEHERGKKGTHLRRGEMTVGDIVDFFIVAHTEEHLAQIKDALGE